MSLSFINIHGECVSVPEKPVKRKSLAKEPPASFHKGWLVEGIPPGALEAAIDANRRVSEMAAKAGGAPIAPIDTANWLMNAKAKRLRSKPYEIESAAKECAALAEKAGWLRIRIVEVKKEAAPLAA